MHEPGRDLREGLEDEGAQVQSRMGDDEVGLVDAPRTLDLDLLLFGAPWRRSRTRPDSHSMASSLASSARGERRVSKRVTALRCGAWRSGPMWRVS